MEWQLNVTAYDFNNPVLDSITLNSKWILEKGDTAVSVNIAEDPDNKTTTTIKLDGMDNLKASNLEEVAKEVKSKNADKNVTIVLKAEYAEYTETTEQKAILKQGNTDNKETLTYIDITLTKYLNDSSFGEAISDTGSDVVEVIIPFDKSNKKYISLYRYNDNAVTTFAENDTHAADTFYIEGSGKSASIHVFTTKFSEFALGYLTDDSGMSLSLNGDIGVNFYIDVNCYLNSQELENAFVLLWYNHNSTSYGTDITSDRICIRDVTIGKDGTGKFSCSIVPGQMVDEMTAELYDSYGTLVYCKKTSVCEYYNSVIGNSTNEKMKALCVAMRDYGSTCQTYFDYNADNLANGGEYNHRLNKAKTSGITDLWYNQRVISGVTFMAQSKSSLRFYLTGQATSVSCENAKNGEMVAQRGYSSSGNYAAVTNIPAAKLDEDFELKIDETVEASGSALSFAKRVIEYSDTKEFIDLAKAMILYNKAAKAYFDSIK